MEFDPNVKKEQRKKRDRDRGERKRVKNKPTDVKTEKRVKIIERFNLLVSVGYIDKRNSEKICSRCKRKCIHVDIDGNYNSETHTETSYVVKTKTNYIYWQAYCLECASIRNKKWRSDPSNFNSVLAKSLEDHLYGTLESFLKIAGFIRNRDNDTCQLCNANLIPQIKSGWRQLSLNDMHPDRRIIEKKADMNDVVCSCLACNYFQNKLSWEDTKNAISIIRDTIPNQLIIIPDFFNTLSKTEQRWVCCGARDQDVCPDDLRKLIVNRDQDICRLTGVKVVFRSHCWNTASYDRIDSKLPYTIENTQLVCKHINFVKKGAITIDEFNLWLKHIRTPTKI